MSSSPARELEGKTAVVTGSAGGIGRAVARELAAAGAAVVVHGRNNRGDAEATAADVRKAGAEAEIILADFANEPAVREFADAAWQWRGGIDIWINNAGVDVL